MDIYDMKLHETYHEDNGNIDITRGVPDGWIYNYAFRQSSIFVPAMQQKKKLLKVYRPW